MKTEIIARGRKAVGGAMCTTNNSWMARLARSTANDLYAYWTTDEPPANIRFHTLCKRPEGGWQSILSTTGYATQNVLVDAKGNALMVGAETGQTPDDQRVRAVHCRTWNKVDGSVLDELIASDPTFTSGLNPRVGVGLKNGPPDRLHPSVLATWFQGMGVDGLGWRWSSNPGFSSSVASFASDGAFHEYAAVDMGLQQNVIVGSMMAPGGRNLIGWYSIWTTDWLTWHEASYPQDGSTFVEDLIETPTGRHRVLISRQWPDSTLAKEVWEFFKGDLKLIWRYAYPGQPLLLGRGQFVDADTIVASYRYPGASELWLLPLGGGAPRSLCSLDSDGAMNFIDFAAARARQGSDTSQFLDLWVGQRNRWDPLDEQIVHYEFPRSELA